MPADDVPEYQNWPASREEREEIARDAFGRYLVLSYDSRISLANKMLFEGYRYPSVTIQQERNFEWISRLSDEDRKNAFAFVQEIADGTVFSIMNKVDGTSGSIVGGNSTSSDGVYGDYSDRLHIQMDIYRNEYKDSQEMDLVESLSINKQENVEPQYELHDLWLKWLQKYSRWK